MDMKVIVLWVNERTNTTFFPYSSIFNVIKSLSQPVEE